LEPFALGTLFPAAQASMQAIENWARHSTHLTLCSGKTDVQQKNERRMVVAAEAISTPASTYAKNSTAPVFRS
jgi:hypothetical protein